MEGRMSTRSHVDFGPIKLEQPFQIVELEFTPPGAADPVVAIDAVDLDSIPHLQKKQVVSIDYDVHDPRIARLQAGTRNFPSQARRQVLTIYGAFATLFLGVLIWRLVRYSVRRKTPKVPPLANSSG
jgi:arginase family enzyme